MGFQPLNGIKLRKIKQNNTTTKPLKQNKMIITINKKTDNAPIVTVDTSTCYYPYAIKDAIKLALKIDGHDEETINEVFGIMPDVCCDEPTFKSE
jgi:hypothetical protein